MKYPVLFLFRLIYLFFEYIIALPLYFITCLLISIWEFNLNSFREFIEDVKEEPFYKPHYSKEYYYLTAKDFLFNKKTYTKSK
jgi:hypothetical protein